MPQRPEAVMRMNRWSETSFGLVMGSWIGRPEGEPLKVNILKVLALIVG